ncbi:hypothetical protein K438DRAFT_1981971 [Mycena galopus ATCC 62051]|nr:hypothetical protein K438DRAFT_1981971 [Mycena galopus ATCC 62051]
MASSSAAPFTQMPPKTADLDEPWAFLTGGVDNIMTQLETPRITLQTISNPLCNMRRGCGMRSRSARLLFPVILVFTLPHALLDFDADEDLQRMYALLARIPEGLEPLRKKFEAHSGELDLKAYVDALLAAVGGTREKRGDCREELQGRGSNAARSPELLAKHADMLLRKSNKVAGDVDLEGALNQVRDEAEASMISKLKEACGFEYTNKLQRMFTGGTSRTNHDDIDIAFSLMMLGTNFWPLARPTHDFLLPPELLPTFERFTRYYQTKAAMLLQYNRNDTLSLPELQEATKISTEILTQVLALLVKAKVLVNEEKDQYDLNPGFKVKKIRVNLNLPIKAERRAQGGGRGQQVRDPGDIAQDDEEPGTHPGGRLAPISRKR